MKYFLKFLCQFVSFFLVFTIGFLSCVAVIVGGAAFVYCNVSIDKLNDWGIGIDTGNFKAETCGEVLFVADHNVDVFGDLAVDLTGALGSADALPEAGTVVEVVAGDGSVLFGFAQSFDGDFGSVLTQSGEDTAGVEVTDTVFAEDLIPVDIAGFEL